MSPTRVEQLLENRSWMQPLARSLLGDSNAADDVVQEAWIAAHEASPDVNVTRPWLARVVRNLSSRVLRTRSRRTRRERVVARSEVLGSTPESVVQRAELHAQVTDVVMKLEEPYRTTVLLRFFEGLSPRDIAQREDVPVSTVRTRTRRALERLRESLDARYKGERAAWCTAILPLAAIPSVAAQLSGTATSGTSTTAHVVHSGVAGSTRILGGLIVTKKTILVTSLIVGAAVGVGADRVISSKTVESTAETPAAVEDDALRRQLEQTETALSTERAATQSAGDQIAELKNQLAALQQKATEAALANDARVAAEAGRSLPVAFGDYADLEVWKTTDWENYGEAAVGFLDVIRNALEAEGHVPMKSPEFQGKLARENIKLAKLALSLEDLPSHAPGNGPYTHPLVQSNLMNAVLEHEDLALSDAQLEAMQERGARYDTRYAELQDEYDDETVPFRKVLDEMALKRDTLAELRDLLNDAQEARLFLPQTEGTGLDLFSPILMGNLATQGLPVADAESGRGKYVEKIGEALGFTEYDAQLASVPLNKAWEALSENLAEPTPFGGVRTDTAIESGYAQADLVEALLNTPGLSDASRDKIASANRWLIPVLKPKK